MPTPLQPSATLYDLRSKPQETVAFARKVLGVMSKASRDHGFAVMRMGITGTGQQPNYRLEDASGNPFIAIDGANHQPWPDDAKFGESGNWSTATMSAEDVKGLIASITGYKGRSASEA